jgi:hypothetical protein
VSAKVFGEVVSKFKKGKGIGSAASFFKNGKGGGKVFGWVDGNWKMEIQSDSSAPLRGASSSTSLRSAEANSKKHPLKIFLQTRLAAGLASLGRGLASLDLTVC